jgi:ankyrin repeat protein
MDITPYCCPLQRHQGFCVFADSVSLTSDFLSISLAPDLSLTCVQDKQYTPLHLACRSGHYPVAQALLWRNADIHATDAVSMFS